MKTLMITSVLFASAAFAAGENFEQRKKMALENLDKRIATMNTLKSCMSSSSDKDGMKACRKTHKTSMEALRSSNKAKRSQMKAAKK